MGRTPKISEAEWEVMKVLWARAPRTGNEVVEALKKRTGWRPTTVKTLLARLMKKGAVAGEKRGREYAFVPAVAEAQCVRKEARSFLKRVYNGATMPMIAGFLHNEKLSREEISSLRRMLDEIERKA